MNWRPSSWLRASWSNAAWPAAAWGARMVFVIAEVPAMATAGELVVETSFDCPDYRPSLALIDSQSGARSVLLGPDGALPTCGFVGTGSMPEQIYALGVDAEGRILLTDADGPESRLLRFEPATSTTSVVSGCSVAASASVGRVCGGPVVGSGALGSLVGDIVSVPHDVAGGSGLLPGEIVVAVSREASCLSGGYSILRIDPVTGDRTTLSGLDDDCSTIVGGGDPFVEPNGFLLLDDGRLLVADGDGGIGRLMAVQPSSGNRMVLSGCSAAVGTNCAGPVVGSGPLPDAVVDLEPISGGAARVATRASFEAYCGAGESGGLLVFDLETGNRTVLSGRDDACSLFGAGPHFKDLESMTLGADGMLLVSEDSDARIVEVDPQSGARRIVSGCSDISSSLDCVGPVVGSGPAAGNHGSLVALPEPQIGRLLSWSCAWLASIRRRR